MLVLLLVGATIILISRSLRRKVATASLAPGPRGLPLLGCIFSLPRVEYWRVYKQWSLDYSSEIVSFPVGQKHVVVINTLKMAKRLFEGRSAIYSERPDMPMMNEYVGFTWNLTFMHYHKEYKEHRKLVHQMLLTSNHLQYRPHAQHYTSVTLRKLLQDPENYAAQLRYLATSYVMRIAHGSDIKSTDDPAVITAEKGMQAMANAGYGSFLDFFPILQYLPKWFPGAGFKRNAALWKVDVMGMVDVPWAIMKDPMNAGTFGTSVASSLLEQLHESPDEANMDIARSVSRKSPGSFMQSSASLMTFVLAMTIYPDVQKRAQDAVDLVLGGKRLPTFEDDIPYVDALVKETLRWNAIVPLGVPHSVSRDDVVDGILIPEGSIIHTNVWAILRQEDVYGPETDKFCPERFLKDGKLDRSRMDSSPAFGFGRRGCPGHLIARDLIWIAIASVLAVFEIKKGVDENGVPIEPSGRYTSAFLSHPFPFRCRFEPRSQQASRLILECGYESAHESGK